MPMKPAKRFSAAAAGPRNALLASVGRDGLAAAVLLVATDSFRYDDGVPLYARPAGDDDHGVHFIADPNAPITLGCKVAVRNRYDLTSYEIGVCVAATAHTVALRFSGAIVWRFRRPPYWVAPIVARAAPVETILAASAGSA